MAGEGDQAAGKVKEVTGKLTDNERLEAEGKTQNLGGKAEEKVDNAGDRIKGAADGLKDKFKN